MKESEFRRIRSEEYNTWADPQSEIESTAEVLEILAEDLKTNEPQATMEISWLENTAEYLRFFEFEPETKKRKKK
jgi:hypothetical protein